MSGFQRAAAIQARVIGALMLRDLVSEGGRTSVPFIRAVIRPTAMILVLYAFGRAARGLAPEGFPLLVFVITGYLTWLAFIRCFSAIRVKGGGVLMFPQVTPLDLILSKVGVEFATYTIVFVGFSALGLLFEQASAPADPLGVILAFWSAIGLGSALGMIAASISRFTSFFEEIFAGVRMVGHAASGVFALASDTPTFLLDFLRWNPLFHSVEWLRESWWSSYKSPIADPVYIFWCLFFLVAIALAFERSTRRWQAQ